MNRSDLQILARVRLVEAKALLSSGLPDGAYYLSGYAVECALKACIAKGTQRHEFPDKKIVDASHTHNLKELVKIANLEVSRLEEVKRNPVFSDHWDIVQEWSERSRYRRHDARIAEALVRAISERNHGVMAWIREFW